MLFWHQSIMKVGAISVAHTTGTGTVWMLVPKETSLVTWLPAWGLQGSTWDYTTALGSGTTLSTWRTMPTTAPTQSFLTKSCCLLWRKLLTNTRYTVGNSYWQLLLWVYHQPTIQLLTPVILAYQTGYVLQTAVNINKLCNNLNKKILARGILQW